MCKKNKAASWAAYSGLLTQHYFLLAATFFGFLPFLDALAAPFPLEEDFFPVAATALRSTVPAVKAGRWRSAIAIFCPVRGCVPVRATDLRTSKVPKPVSVSLSPEARAF